MRDSDEFAEVEVELVKVETDRALLVVVKGAESWIPKSVIDAERSEVAEKGDSGILLVAEWFAEKEGLT